ncbi:MAG TPA: BlaI/MecI/CopY family transcriptional regulator [bacterium]|nr:BlaI/MecI/CopY family transcriptional regulator [bacterium]
MRNRKKLAGVLVVEQNRKSRLGMRQESETLTPVEWELMEAIWQLGGSPCVRDVLEFAYPGGEKAYTTVQTVMNILVKKNLLTVHKTGLVNFYTPTRSRREVVKTETRHLVSRFFGGSLRALADHLIDSEDLDVQELHELKKLLDKKTNEQGSDQL